MQPRLAAYSVLSGSSGSSGSVRPSNTKPRNRLRVAGLVLRDSVPRDLQLSIHHGFRSRGGDVQIVQVRPITHRIHGVYISTPHRLIAFSIIPRFIVAFCQYSDKFCTLYGRFVAILFAHIRKSYYLCTVLYHIGLGGLLLRRWATYLFQSYVLSPLYFVPLYLVPLSLVTPPSRSVARCSMRRSRRGTRHGYTAWSR